MNMAEPFARVSIARIENDDTDAAIRRALADIGGIGAWLRPGMHVMLKPNYTGNLPEDSGGVTSNAVLESVIRLVQQAGAARVTLLEGCGTIALGTQKIFDSLGVTALCARYGVALKDANLEPMTTLHSPRFRELQAVECVADLAQYDLIINLPVMKTHPLVDTTIAMKNMNGLLSPRQKRAFHDVNLRQAIVDFHQVLPPYLTIVDGRIGMEGMGPAEGSPVPLGLILAGDNPAAVDAVGSRIMGFDPAQIRYLQYAAEAGIGPVDMARIRLSGARVEDVCRPFAPAVPRKAAWPGITVHEAPSGLHCVGCRAVMTIALDRIQAAGQLEQFAGLHILLNGSPETAIPLQSGERLLCLGQCAGPYWDAHRTEPGVYGAVGCAPAGLTVEDAIRAIYQVPRPDTAATSAVFRA